MAAWNAEPNKHYDRPPAGLTVPVYLALGNVPAGHVAISLDDGVVASSTQAGVHSTPYYHKNLDDVIAVYGKYNGGATYLGWGEHVGSVQVVQMQSNNATDAQIQQAYLEILGRAADDGGLAHYRNYTIDFVRQDLLNSAEYKTVLANRQAQEQAARDAQAKAEAQAQADADAAAKAKAEADARQKAIDDQAAADAAAQNDQNINKENNNLLKQILDLLQAFISQFNNIFKGGK